MQFIILPVYSTDNLRPLVLQDTVLYYLVKNFGQFDKLQSTCQHQYLHGDHVLLHSEHTYKTRYKMSIYYME